MKTLDLEKLMPGLMVKNFCDQNNIHTSDDLDKWIYEDEENTVFEIFREFVEAYLNEGCNND